MRALPFVLVGAAALASLIEPARALDLGPPQIGFDTEVRSRSLQNLIPWFDLEHLEAWARENHQLGALLDDAVVEDYVLSKEAFLGLPEELRAELSAGLDLDRSTGLQARFQKLLGPDGKPVEPRMRAGGLVPSASAPGAFGSVPDAHLMGLPAVLPKRGSRALTGASSPIPPSHEVPATLAPLQDLRESTTTPIQSDWPELNRRWNALPIERKREAVTFRHLAARRTAEVILRLPVEVKKTEPLMELVRLKPGAPEWMQRLVWSLDGRIEEIEGVTRATGAVFELALRGVEGKKEEAQRIVTNLLAELKLTQLMSQPQRQTRMDVAFHWHVSYPSVGDYDTARVRGFQHRLEQTKLLMLTRILAGGPQNDLVLFNTDRYKSEGRLVPIQLQNIYDTPIAKNPMDRIFGGHNLDKGLIHLAGPNHAELREQTSHPALGLEEFLHRMALKDDDKFHAEVSQEISGLLQRDPTIFKRIARENPKILADYAGALGVEPISGLLTRSMLQSTPKSPEFWELFKALDGLGDHPAVATALLELARNGRIELGPTLYRFERSSSRRLLEEALIEAPHLFTTTALHYLSPDPLTRHLAENWDQLSESHRTDALSLLLRRPSAHRLDRPDSPPSLLRAALRNDASRADASGFLARAYDLLHNPETPQALRDAAESGGYPGLSREHLERLVTTIVGSTEERKYLAWYWNFWSYYRRKPVTEQAALNTYRFLADRIGITYPAFFEAFRDEIRKPDFGRDRVSPMVQMLMPLRARDEFSRTQVDDVVRMMRSRYPADVARLVDKRARRSGAGLVECLTGRLR